MYIRPCACVFITDYVDHDLYAKQNKLKSNKTDLKKILQGDRITFKARNCIVMFHVNFWIFINLEFLSIHIQCCS